MGEKPRLSTSDAADAPARDSTPRDDATYPFVGVHGWFELAVDL